MMRFDQIPSATPDAPNRTALRLDPYWDGLWQFGSAGQWVKREHAQRLRAAGVIGQLPGRLRTDPAEALARIDADWQRKLDILGALAGWRTLTAEQQAAFAGTVAAGTRDRVIGDLFALGLIDSGTIWAPTSEAAGADRAALWRPATTEVFDKLLAPLLTYAETVSVTGGESWTSGSQFDRHNILTAELCLRLAEFTRIGTVLGERLSRVRTLAYSGAGAPEPPGVSNQTADAVIVRRDGLRIAIETTAHTGGMHRFVKKVKSWCDVFARRPLETNGLVVCFVGVDRVDVRAEKSVHYAARKAIARATRDVPGIASNRTADRIFYADWTDLFPAPREASADLFTFRAQRPNGPSGGWADAHLLDEESVPFDPSRMPVDPTAVITNVSGIRATPHWLRDPVDARPQLHMLPLREAGLDPIPHPVRSRRTGVRLQDLGSKNREIGGAIQPPARLRF